MKLIKRIVFFIVAAMVILFLGFNFVYKEKNENFFKEGVKQVYINKGIKSHDYSFIKKEMIENEKEDLWKRIDLGRKLLKDVYVFSFGSLNNKLSSEVMVVDTGIGFLGIRAKVTDYFDEYNEKEEIFILKENKKPKSLQGIDIYLKPYRGYFVVATSDKMINFFLEMPKAENSNTVDLDKKSKNGILGKVVMDLSNEGLFKALGINGAVTGIDIKNEKLRVSNEFYGEGFLRRSLEEQPEERKYESYAGRDRIYISGNNLGSSIAMVVKGIQSNELENLNIIFNMLGLTMEDLFNQIDGEIIVDMERSSGIIPLKSTKNIRSVFRLLGQNNRIKYGNQEMVLDGDLLKIGNIEKTEDNLKIEKENFLYGDISMNLYDSSFTDGARGILSGKATKKTILMELELNEEATRNIADQAF